MTKRFALQFTALGVLFLCLAVFWSWRLQTHFPARPEGEQLLYIPSGKYLKPLSLGYPQVLADMLWLRSIAYFGTHAVTDRQYPWLVNLLDAITTLDPEWEFPFHFAGVVLSVEANMATEANRLLRKAVDLHPDTWQFPFYMGFNYFHVLNNPKCGAKYIFKASTNPKAPKYLPALAAKLSAKGNDLENHILMCNQLLALTKDPEMQKSIKKNCAERIKTIADTATSSAGGPAKDDCL